MSEVPQPITKEIARRFNHLQGVYMTNGKIKINWKTVWEGRKKQ